MNAFALSGLFTGITCSILLIIILVYGKSKLHRVWALFTLCVTIWGIGAFFIGQSNTEITSIASWKFAMSGVIFIPILFLHTISIFCELSSNILILFAYLQGLIFLFINLFTNFFTKDMRFVFSSFYYIQYTETYHHIFLLLWIGLVIHGHYKLFKFYKHSFGFKKQEAFYFFLYMAIGFGGGSLNFLPIYKIDIYPFLNFTIPIACLIVTYAIFRYQIMNLDIVIRKGLVYSILITIFTLVYLSIVILTERIFQGIIGYRSILISILFASIIALIFTPLKNKIQSFIDKIFLGKDPIQIAKENELLHQELERSERLKAVGTFAAGLAHEIKNPLTAIKIFSQYLPEKYQDPEFLEKFSHLVPEQIDRIDNLVHELLDFAKPAPLQLRETDIHGLLDGTLDLLSNEFLKHKIKVIKEYNTDAHGLKDTDTHGLNIRANPSQIRCNPCIIKVDPNRIKQVFLNLFLNAIDAMPEGGCLTVITETEDNPCTSVLKSVCIRVQDTGSGIPQDDLKHLFEPFYSTKKEGTGLGLSVVYNIIKEHKGEITVESKVGEGTKFIIELPLIC